MIKKYLLGIFFVAFSGMCTAQSLSVATINSSNNNDLSTFNLKNGKVSLNQGMVQFSANGKTVNGYMAYGVSPDHTVVSVLHGTGSGSRITLFSSTGDSLSTFEVTNLSIGDPSIAVYPANTGAALVRDNIANFNFYNSFGEIIVNLSGSSQSEGGESISEVVMSHSAETVLIYTPKIKRDSKLGSQIQYVDSGMNLKSLFFSTDRYIKTMSLTGNGQFVTFITSQEGTEDKIHVTDRYGNEIASITQDENLKGAKLSENAGFTTAFSGKRVLVFDTMTKERIGSTSFRAEVIDVSYFPEDNTIVAMTGSYADNTGTVSDVEFHAVNLVRRKVQRKEYPSAIGLNKKMQSGFIRSDKNRYHLIGANKKLELSVSF